MAQTGVKSEKLAPWWVWALIAVATMGFLGLFIALILWAPPLLVVRDKATDDAYLRAITDTRTTLVQAVGGFAVFLGVVVGFFTLRHNRQLLRASRIEHQESLQASRDALEQTLAFNRESLTKTATLTERGQITDRYTKAIEQLGQPGADSVDLRLGGIYALEQIARESEDWYRPVIEVLAAFVRQHAGGLPQPDGHTIDAQLAALNALPIEQRLAKPRADVAAAIDVLGRRGRKYDAAPVDLDRTNFCRIEFSTVVEDTVRPPGRSPESEICADRAPVAPIKSRPFRAVPSRDS